MRGSTPPPRMPASPSDISIKLEATPSSPSQSEVEQSNSMESVANSQERASPNSEQYALADYCPHDAVEADQMDMNSNSSCSADAS